MEHRIIIAGSREFLDYPLLEANVSKIISSLDGNVRIISGCARGADKLGIQYAKEHNIALSEFPADWNRYGKSAGYKRNTAMAEFAVSDSNKGILVAFWDGISRGTKHMIDIAYDKGLEVHVIKF